MFAIGVDLTRLSRFSRLLQHSNPYIRKRVPKKILSPPELQDFNRLSSSLGSQDEMARFLAVRWAVKEASYKALFPHCKLSWQHVALVKDHSVPLLQILRKDEVMKNVDIGQSLVSISHDGDLVIAQVMFHLAPRK